MQTVATKLVSLSSTVCYLYHVSKFRNYAWKWFLVRQHGVHHVGMQVCVHTVVQVCARYCTVVCACCYTGLCVHPAIQVYVRVGYCLTKRIMRVNYNLIHSTIVSRILLSVTVIC